MHSQDTRIKIKKTIADTQERRSHLSCKVIQTKIDKSSLSDKQVDHLNRLFVEAKWLYNDILSSDNINDYDTKKTEVQVKIGEIFEPRSLDVISAQMRQSIKTRVFTNIQGLKALKQKGHTIGKLKFKSQVNSIPLKQMKATFDILKEQGRIRIQGIRKPLRVRGLKQLPKNCEIACATLTRRGNDFYVHITVYTEKKVRQIPEQAIGIDFGCNDQITLSNGIKVKWLIPVSKRIKRLDQKIARSKKHQEKTTKNREKTHLLRQSAYAKLDNRKKDVRDKVAHVLTSNFRCIAFQDDNLRGWQKGGHGKKSNGTALGMLRSVLKNKTSVPMAVGKWCPSSQLCSACGKRQKLSRSERTYSCPSCGMILDRDINAARNILAEGLRINNIPTERRDFKPVEMVTSAVTDLLTKMMSQSKFLSVNQETQPSLVVG
jgi:putative transposase